MRKDNHFSPIIFALILIGGIWLGQFLKFSNNTNANENNKFNLILHQLDELYVDSLGKEELVEKAVENLLRRTRPSFLLHSCKRFRSCKRTDGRKF